jgi:hypothetical protein
MRHNPDRGIMRQLVRESGVIAFGVPEGFKEGHLHEVGRHAVRSLIAAMPDGCPCRAKELLRLRDALYGVQTNLRRGGEVRGQAVDLLNVENRVTFEERNIALGFFAALSVGLGAGKG